MLWLTCTLAEGCPVNEANARLAGIQSNGPRIGGRMTEALPVVFFVLGRVTTPRGEQKGLDA